MHAIVTRASALIRRVDLEIRKAIRNFSDIEGLHYNLRVEHEVVSPMRSAIGAIPAHELGPYEMAEAVRQLYEAFGNLDEVLQHGIDKPSGFERDPSV